MFCKLISAGMLVAVCCLAATSQAAETWAEKMFDSLKYDFEGLAKGSSAEHRFTIKNLYREDVHIKSVSSSCGCTKPQLTKTTLKTGEVAELIANFDTIKFEGSHTATLTVRFDRPYPAEVRLDVRGFVRKDVVITPGRLQLGAVDAGTRIEHKVKISYAGRSDWQIVDVRSRNTNLEVELSPKQLDRGQISYVLLVRLKKTTPPGYINDRLTIVTNDSRYQYIPLSIEGHILSSLSVSPSSLHIGVVAPGKKVTKQLVIRGKKPFRIVRIRCGDDCFEFKTPKEAKTLHLIPVTFRAGDKRGKIVEQIEIETDAANGTLRVAAYAEVKNG